MKSHYILEQDINIAARYSLLWLGRDIALYISQLLLTSHDLSRYWPFRALKIMKLVKYYWPAAGFGLSRNCGSAKAPAMYRSPVRILQSRLKNFTAMKKKL